MALSPTVLPVIISRTTIGPCQRWPVKMTQSFLSHVWQHAGCLAESFASSHSMINHGVRDKPHAMMLLVSAFVLLGALNACQVWGPDMLQVSPCGQSSLQSDLLSIASMFWSCVAP
jgi:hypothetical protein